MDDSFSCFLALSKTCRLNIAEGFDDMTHKLSGKQQISYNAHHLVILQPMLIHSGVSFADLRSAGDNMRCFISVGTKLSANNSQVWFVESNNDMNIAPGKRDGKYDFKIL